MQVGLRQTSLILNLLALKAFRVLLSIHLLLLGKFLVGDGEKISEIYDVLQYYIYRLNRFCLGLHLFCLHLLVFKVKLQVV